jgi:hypothetical protein
MKEEKPLLLDNETLLQTIFIEDVRLALSARQCGTQTRLPKTCSLATYPLSFAFKTFWTVGLVELTAAGVRDMDNANNARSDYRKPTLPQSPVRTCLGLRRTLRLPQLGERCPALNQRRHEQRPSKLAHKELRSHLPVISRYKPAAHRIVVEKARALTTSFPRSVFSSLLPTTSFTLPT